MVQLINNEVKPLRENIHGNLVENKRIQGLDIARTFAILCVILCHCVEAAYSDINYGVLSNVSQIFRIIFFTVGRLGVPIFLFLTGALTLKKQIETDEDVIKFYKRNLLPLLITIEIWNVLYNLFNWIITDYFSLKTLLKNILFFEQVKMPNMWYMPMILGIYISIPFLAKIVKTFSFKTIILPMILVFITSTLLPSVNVVLSISKMGPYKTILDLNFLGGIYGLYILVGYYINNKIFEKYNNKLFVFMSIVFLAITCFIQYWSYNNIINYNVWYNFVTLFICSICLFELFVRIENQNNSNIFIKVTKYISKISLGIFFIHEIFLNLLIKNIGRLNLNNPTESIILFILSSVFSIIFIFITSKVKIIRERVFFIKG